MDEGVVAIVIAQMAHVQDQHPGLELILEPGGELMVRGPVGFRIDHDGHTVEDSYDIELRIPDDYPDSPPAAYEVGGRITEAYEHFMQAGNFCLGAPVEVRRRFARDRTLAGFINDQVIPFLFRHSYLETHRTPPFGELDHGSIGLLDYYMRHFNTGVVNTLKLLKCLADNFAPPLGPCPCGSGQKLQDCHGPKLDELRPHYWPEMFEHELREMIEMARKADIDLPERDVLPARMWKRRQKRQRNKRRH